MIALICCRQIDWGLKSKEIKPWQAYKAAFLCLQAIMHSFASTAEGSCALIKLTSKYPCRHLQNTQKPLKCAWDGNLLCMYAAVLINSLFRLQPRLALQPAEHISSVPLSHRGHYSNSLTHESLLWLNQSSEVTPAAGAGLCELLTTDCCCKHLDKKDKKLCYNSTLSKLRKLWGSIRSKNDEKQLRRRHVYNTLCGCSVRFNFSSDCKLWRK